MRFRLLVPGLLLVTACLATGDGSFAPTTAPDEAPVLEETGSASATSEVVDDQADPNELDGDAFDDEVVRTPPETVRNPLGPGCADPGVVRIPGENGPTFWAACTGRDFPLFRSRDLVTWTPAGHVFKPATRPGWASGNWWAPEIHRVGEGLIVYFTALSTSRGKMCIGAARAATVAGPWRDLGRPLVCDAHVSLIDSHVYSGADGRRYLYYKTDGNGLQPKERTIIYGHELRADGVGFVGQRRALLSNTLAWEGDLVEAPWVIKRGSYYYLFYSGFRYCNATYGTGVARSKSPLGPFVKRSRPILASNGAWSGPGHNSIVRTGGRAWIVYHAWPGRHECEEDGSRKLMLDPISWSGGWPSVGNGTPSSGVRPAPVVP